MKVDGLRLRVGVLAGALLFVPAVPAMADPASDIARTCQVGWYEQARVCACVGELAVSSGRFNAEQLTWLALPPGQLSEAAAIASAMSVGEGVEITNFMTDAIRQCTAAMTADGG